MIKYNTIIKLIEDIKSNLNNFNYASEEILERDFYQSISLVWDDLRDLRTADLRNMYEVQSYLINNVCHIHESENSISNEQILRANINIRQANLDLADGKRAYNIYSFNDESGEYYLIGDIHSDTISIDRILEKTLFFKKIFNGDKIRLIFLGDYVDRGKAHLKTIHYILSLKHLFPGNIFLLRGNHDGGSFIDEEVKMWVRKPEKDPYEDWFLYYLYELCIVNPSLNKDVIHNCLKLFNSLANISFISVGNAVIMGSHGGIPRVRQDNDGLYSYIKSISDLTNEDIVDKLNKSIVNNMIWSDPSTNDEDLREDKGRFRFTQGQFEEFRKLIGFDLFVRGHQVEEMGYKKFFQDRLITIFSSGTISQDDENINHETAYTRVNPKIIHIDTNGHLNILDLNKRS